MKSCFRNMICVLFVFFVYVPNAQASCDTTTGDIIEFNVSAGPVKDNGRVGDQCQDIPDAYEITFYKMALCTENPSPSATIGGTPNFTSCSYIYNGPALVHEIEYPASSPLDISPFTIPPGTYPYLVATFSSKLGLKNTVTFNNTVVGSGASSGTTCWTSGGVTSFANEAVLTAHGQTLGGAVNTITCGAAAAAAPVYNFEIFTHFVGDDCATSFSADSNFANGSNTETALGGGIFTARLLKNNGTYADRCLNSARMLWVINNTTPVVVTPTSKYSIQFKLTDSVSIDFDSGTSQIVKMGNDPIQAIFTATE
jgi:hypothetical protein